MITTTTHTTQSVRRRRKGQSEDGVLATGETPALLERFEEIHENEIEIGLSPFDNAPWDVTKDFEVADVFELAVMALVLIPQLLLVYPVLFVLLLPPVSCNLFYINVMVPKVTDHIQRTTLWKAHCFIQAVLCIPAAALALMSLLVSRAAMLIFGTIYCTLDEGGWARYRRNLDVIKPYCNGPPLYRYFADCVAVAAGMVHRRGLVEFTSSFAIMFVLVPWVKYWITGNIYTSDLGERFITQFGEQMDDMTLEQVASSFRAYLSKAKHSEANREYIHNPLLFCPHFPFPPRGKRRKFAIGLEHSGIACFVHTRHFKSKPSNYGNGRSESRYLNAAEPPALSRSAEVPVYRVILWRSNPYHIYTGVVEASISTKQQALEHPMWLISAHNKLACDPKILMSTSWIDLFFDRFIPHLDHFIRMNELGREAADSYAGNVE
ncbi:hypothetical protein ACHAXT_007552 [Thalassiosira profunda]